MRVRRALLFVVLGACTPVHAPLDRPLPETLPAGSPLRSRTLSDTDAWLRHHLMGGAYAEALQLVRGEHAPGDALLRRLQAGIVLHQAGEYRESNAAFEWAEREADERYTRSVSREVGSLLASDRLLAYTPTMGELAMIPYYRMLNYAALGERASVEVEARKASALLTRGEGGTATCGEGAFVLYLAGLVLASASEHNDALVSLRHAQRAFDGCADAAPPASLGADLHAVALAAGIQAVADSAVERYGLALVPRLLDEGDLVLLVEQGFVAHRAEQSLHLPLFARDIDGLESGQTAEIAAVAGVVSARLLEDMAQRAVWGRAWRDEPLYPLAAALEGAYILRLAWPVHRHEALRPAGVRVFVDGSAVSAAPAADLSAVVARELDGERPAMLTRLVARAVAKYLVSREAERKAEKEGGELAGFLVGRLGNLAAAGLERADTRSWSLLPDRLSVARLRLPAGAHRVRVEALSAAGEVLAVRDLGEVVVEPGGLVLRSERVWGGEDDGCRCGPFSDAR